MFQDIPEELARVDHEVLLVRKKRMGREEMFTLIFSSQIGNNVFGRKPITKTLV